MLFVVLQAALFALFGGAFFGAAGAATALAVSIVVNFWSFWQAGPSVLRSLAAVEIVDDKQLLGIVSLLSARANIPAPRVFEIRERQPNAFVVGASPRQACLLVTTGMRANILTSEELAAVIGHELGHIHRRDTLCATLSATLVSAIVSLALILAVLGSALRRDGGVFLILLAVVAPLCSVVIFMAASRSREYAADRFSAGLIGDPQPLIGALTKLDRLTRRRNNETVLAFPALAQLCIVNPMPRSWLGTMLAMHPSIENRIARLYRATSAESPKDPE